MIVLSPGPNLHLEISPRAVTQAKLKLKKTKEVTDRWSAVRMLAIYCFCPHVGRI